MLEKKPIPRPSITVDATQKGEPISPLVYGQFIEHLGRCIYGGIWAELLEDRKFYYAVGSAQSPWKKVGSPERVQMIQSQPFAGEQDVLIHGSGQDVPVGIKQDGLGLKAGMDYLCRVWINGNRARSSRSAFHGDLIPHIHRPARSF